MEEQKASGELFGRRADDIPNIGRTPALRMQYVNIVVIILAVVFTAMSLRAVSRIFESESYSEHVNEAYRICSSSARDLQEASDYLTTQARMYVVSGDRACMDAFLYELQTADRRGIAVDVLSKYFDDSNEAVLDLREALNYSNELAERELYAMRLTAEATGLEDLPDLVAEVELDPSDAAASPEEQRAIAETMVLGDDYRETKEQISRSVTACSDSLINELNSQVLASNEEMHRRLTIMRTAVVILLLLVLAIIFVNIWLILWPLSSYTRQIKREQALLPTGASELRYLADAYNTIYKENLERTAQLLRAAESDALTGLYNRGAYDQLLAEHSYNMALLLIDVDYFKSVNDTYGHNVGDAVLRKVANRISSAFRSTDYCCRIGGDEFAVIMCGVKASARDAIGAKVRELAESLQDTSDGLPKITLSIGVAFSDSHPGEDDIYRAADAALYKAKENGRNGHAFYGD